MEYAIDIDKYLEAKTVTDQTELQGEGLDELGNRLRSYIEQYGVNCYKDLEWLAKTLKNDGISDINIHRLLLISSVPGFEKLIDNADGLSETFYSNFISNVTDITGVNEYIIIRIVSIILYSLNPEEFPIYSDNYRVSYNRNKKVILPYSLYEEDIRRVAAKFYNNEKDEEYYRILNSLVSIGIPKAKYLYGLGLYASNSGEGLVYITEAANDGDIEAKRFLARVEYEKGNLLGEWEQAYIHYTGAGAAILENEDRENIINIINYGIFNKKIVILNCLMSVVSLFILLLFPHFGLIKGRMIIGIICFVLQLILSALIVFSYRKKPYLNYFISSVLIYVLFIISICLCL